jgi:hypothetical protein
MAYLYVLQCLIFLVSGFIKRYKNHTSAWKNNNKKTARKYRRLLPELSQPVAATQDAITRTFGIPITISHSPIGPDDKQ